MANKNRNLIIAYFPSRDKAEQAAEDLKKWDSDQPELKLGGIGIVTADENGKLKTHKVGSRAGGTGAKWGLILGAVTGVLSGGVTLIGGAIAGIAAGTVAGALFHKKIGMTDEDKDHLVNHLKEGGAALAVMADDEEVEPTKFQLSSQGGEVEHYNVPVPEMERLEEAADVEGVEELDEVVVLDDDSPAEELAAAAAVAAVAEAVDEDDEVAAVVVEELEEETVLLVDEDGQVVAEETRVVDEAEALDDEGHVLAAAAAAATIAAAVGEDDEGNEVVEEVVEVDTISVDDEGHVTEAVAAGMVAAALLSDDEGDEIVEEAVDVEDEGIVTEAAAARVIGAEMDAEEAAEESETAVIHFKRYNEDYDGWEIHVWWGVHKESDWDDSIEPVGKDDFGLIFEVPLHPDAIGLAYIIHRGDEKDQWDDQWLDFSEHGREVWIVQNMPGYVDGP